jgi:septal ring factor EnvC (AmiA/AmiB activator)
MRYIFALILALLPIGASAQSDGGEGARAATALLSDASLQLDKADSARDRVKALTQTIRAYEAGLTAMRSGLRKAAIREEQVSRQLQSRDGEIAQLLGALQSIGGNAEPTIFLHPQGPTGTARAGMLLAELTPVLNTRAAQLRKDLSEVQTLRALQQDAADQLQLGLTEVQRARVALNRAMAERTDLPTRFTADPVRTAILISSTETLDAFASGLSELAPDAAPLDLPPLDDRIGGLTLPAQGIILRSANEADAAGIIRPGILLATRPGALVVAPTEATIRYQGPLLDYGNVVILEPQTGTLFVIAGLHSVYGAAGQVISEGTPLGLMGGLDEANIDTSASTGGVGAGNGASETLYIEVRQDNVPQDPMNWFLTDKDE